MSAPFHPLCDGPWHFANVRIAVNVPILFSHAGQEWAFFQVTNGVAHLKEHQQ